MRVIVLCVLLLGGLYARTQPAAEEHVLSLSPALQQPANEVSGLARYKNEVLLITQNLKSTRPHCIVAIHGSQIDSACAGVPGCVIGATDSFFIRGLTEFADTCAGGYDGLEGAVVVGDQIFFVIETSGAYCHVARGRFGESGDSLLITIDRTLPIRKPDTGYYNAGFESIGWLEKDSLLFVAFERNRYTHQQTAFSFDTAFSSIRPWQFDRPLLFRLSDVSAFPGSRFDLVGINTYYPGKPAERRYYISDELQAARQRMRGRDPQESCYAALVGLKLIDGKVQWEELMPIGWENNNWEGILPWGNGVLMVVDSPGPRFPTRLSYFSFH